MTEVVSDVARQAKAAIGFASPGRKSATVARTRRKSSRPRANSSASQTSTVAPPSTSDWVERFDALTHLLSRLGVSKSGTAGGALANADEWADVSEAPAPRRQSSVQSREKEVCAELFAALKAVPDRESLAKVLLEKPAVPIPIHRNTYEWLLGEVGSDAIKGMFTFVEDVGNMCPKLTPRLEAALQVSVAPETTEAMQQSVLDPFLSAIVGTASEYMNLDTRIDRNANEKSMTKGRDRPDYFLAISGLLVFKGEEKRAGDVKEIALELTKKMIPGLLGKGGKLEYLLGYATAGQRILFECVYGDKKMSECSPTLNLTRVSDRITLLVILVNVVRVACTLYNSKHDQKVEITAAE
ncbi:hypothetical protein H4R19_004741 [Coemansia spiralis]|nr:hypothetical protein H4R19_004741 [Coemansia spiralis]